MGAYLDLWDVGEGQPKAREELERLNKIEAAAEAVCGYILACREDDGCPVCRLRRALLGDLSA